MRGPGTRGVVTLSVTRDAPSSAGSTRIDVRTR